MAQKKITDLQLRDDVTADVNFPSDDGIQSYRVTAQQIKDYILAAGNVVKATLATAVQNALTPSGAVLSYAGSTAPAGFLRCDGSAVSRTTYADLFAAIGTAHGTGDGSTTFNLPDYRGRFLRGWSDAQTRDPDRASRTAMATGGATGDNVGSVQLDAAQGHFHDLQNASGTVQARWRTDLGTGAGGGGVMVNDGSSGIVQARAMQTNGTQGTPRTSSETRPVNAYVMFIIKT